MSSNLKGDGGTEANVLLLKYATIYSLFFLTAAQTLTNIWLKS